MGALPFAAPDPLIERIEEALDGEPDAPDPEPDRKAMPYTVQGDRLRLESTPSVSGAEIWFRLSGDTLVLVPRDAEGDGRNTLLAVEAADP